MRINWLHKSVLLYMGLCVFSSSINAQEKPVPVPTDSTQTAQTDSTNKKKEKKKEKKKTIADLTKSSRKYPGLFTVYEDTTTGALQLLIKKSQIGQEYIYVTHTVTAPVTAGAFRGQYRDNRVF